MRRLAAAVLLLAWAAPAAARQAGRIVEVRVHGNHTTPTEDIIAIAGLTTGAPATPEALADAEARLRASGRFAGVEVRRRFASIEDPTAILVMIVVDEHAAVSADAPIPGPWRRLRMSTLWLPVLSYADGYGFTYGVRVSFDDPLGPDTRLSMPLTLGGERRAGLEFEKTFDDAVVTRVAGGAAAYRRENPHFDIPDVRLELTGRAERRFARWLVAGGTGRVARVDFAGAETRHQAIGADVTIDTRLDPSFPRDAVHARLGWEWLGFEGGGTGRLNGDIRGYVAAGGSRVVALRAQFSRAGDALPLSEQPLLGGSSSLRGYRTGHRAGDNLAAGSIELRVPLSSPLNFARFGVKAFIDAGATWAHGERLADRQFERGIGGGVYAGVANLLLNVDVAWPEEGGSRTHVGMGIVF